MATVEERVSYIEGKIDSLATKEDLAELKVGLADLKAELRGDLLRVAIGFAGLHLIGLGAVAAIMQFLG